jgi:carbon storage regulator
MLMITRRPGERLVLGEDIRIEVVEIAGNTVRLGVAAPREIPVYREELWEAVKAENEAAAKTADVPERARQDSNLKPSVP